MNKKPKKAGMKRAGKQCKESIAKVTNLLEMGEKRVKVITRNHVIISSPDRIRH